MPYCPKCDMEFIDGITVCTDCGGPLVGSEEEARLLKQKEKEEALKKQQEYLERMNRQFADSEGFDDSDDSGDSDHLDSTGNTPSHSGKAQTTQSASHAYVNKSQKYEDLQSSASAFLLVGGILLIGSVLCFAGVIPLPMTGTSRLIFLGALTAMGIFSLGVCISSKRSAKKLQPEIAVEKNRTRELNQWITDSYSGNAVDQQIPDASTLSPEELSLKRFQVIQDLLITGQDLPNQDYVDALSEEIYSHLYE